MVRVDKMVRDINTVILVPEVLSTVMDDSIFAEFDTESGQRHAGAALVPLRLERPF